VDPAGTSQYYNIFTQNDTNGLTIEEKQVPTTLKARIAMSGAYPSVQMTAVSPGPIVTSLTVGQSSSIGSPGQVTLNGNDGLVINDSAGSGSGLQIVHESSTNTNILKQVGSINSVAMRLLANTNTLRFANPSFPNNFIEIPQANDTLVLANGTAPGAARVNTLSQTGMAISQGGGVGGAVGTFGGATMTLDSRTSTTIRTNTLVTPLTNATFNQDGSVTFLNTITAQIGSFLTSITTPLITAVTGAITTLNSTTVNGTTVNSTTLNNTGTATIGTVNSTTLTNTGLTTTGTLTVNTSASIPTANIPLLTGVTQINAIPIARYLDNTPVGTIIMWGGSYVTGGILPAGYLLCNGVTVSQTTYATLYNVIGDTFAIFALAPAGQFTLPDMRNKAPFGASSSQSASYFFNVRGTTMSSLPGTNTPPINPATGSPYPAQQCLQITYIEPGQGFRVLNNISDIVSVTKQIQGIINWDGGTAGENNNLNVILILDSPWGSDLPINFVFRVQSNSQNVGDTKFGNYTNQQGREVGIHKHSARNGGQQFSAPGVTRTEPTTGDTGDNTVTGTFTINGTTFAVPYSMNTTPNSVYMNFLIKYE
jgi:hypothetical protein